MKKKIYKCTCIKCGKKYSSTNELDADIVEKDEQGNKIEIAGDGQCAKCKKETLEIAKKIDIQMAGRRRTRAPAIIPKQLYFDSGN